MGELGPEDCFERVGARLDALHVRWTMAGARAAILISATDYQEEALARARDHVLSIEDVLIHKLIAWRSRDRDDIASILSTGPDIDLAYLKRWAREWEVEDRWREAQAWQ